MPLEKIPADRYSNDRARAHRTARVQLEFVIQNVQHLRRLDTRGRAENAAQSMLMLLKNGETLSPGQLSYADGLYEQTMGAAGYGSMRVHVDKKRKGLKFG